MVYRIYVEKKPELAHEATALLSDLHGLLQLHSVTDVRVINRYDVENVSADLFDACKTTVFAEPQLDVVSDDFDAANAQVFAVEYLPGQFDQRADSAAQCMQIIAQGDRPAVRTAKVYLVYGNVSATEMETIQHYVINPVESRLASLATVETLALETELPTTVETLTGFTTMAEAALADFLKAHGLAMDLDDLKFCQQYFLSEQRDPTITEIRMIDTYWSDHCRHTTFMTTIDSVQFEDAEIAAAWQMYQDARAEIGRTKPMNLMDIGTIAAKVLRKNGKLNKLDESEEINACTVKIKVDVDGEAQDWLLLFKNETHNHPTEIEPFGGAATCIGGAIRDPLSGRSYVYAAMRVTGAADPLKPVSETLAGKLPQRKIVTTAAAGYSSYGNQIGLATGMVDELYHDGYAAKRMEIGAVIAAAPAKNVRRERPAAGDSIILLGGRTGRDGCGGATGSSKSHTQESLASCGAEVQKGNAPEERKLQRLFRNEEASQLIKRCNDFGAGGVSVAIGELADGLSINLNAVPRKYDGLDGTELAISESQERMAVVVEKKDEARFLELAATENLEASVVAVVTEEARLRISWNDVCIVDLSRKFLDSNGAEKHIDIAPAAPQMYKNEVPTDFVTYMQALVSDLNICSKRGLSERFDASIGAGTVLMPFGGAEQQTPIQAMVHKISVEKGTTDTCSMMAWGYNPFLSSCSPYHGAYHAVIESVSKLVATGAKFEDVYLTFQEYFEKPMRDAKRWGKPLAALLGSFRAQMDLEIAAIGGKDSMSGSFEDLDVPPTLVSFAVTTEPVKHILQNAFTKAGNRVVRLSPDYLENGMPETTSLRALFDTVHALITAGKAAAVYTPTLGGVAEAVYKMSIGNNLGFAFDAGMTLADLVDNRAGSFIVELSATAADMGTPVGVITDDGTFTMGDACVSTADLLDRYEGKLESVFSCNIHQNDATPETYVHSVDAWTAPATKTDKPRVLIPVFPGTNCEYDTAKVMEQAGAQVDLFVVRNLTAEDIAASVAEFAARVKLAQIIFIPGGFSGGDEPDGSAKFITSFFRNTAIKEAVTDLLDNRDGLMCGICNGFQALIKLGLVPYGKIMDTDESCPTLTFNTIARHQSRLVRTRIASNKSPWLRYTNAGEVYTVPISHGEGRFLAEESLIAKLAKNGQIATQYVDASGNPTYDIRCNPNNSMQAIEGITSPDGRVFGKMGHSERIGDGLYKNVYGAYDMQMFKAAVDYFRK